eukprot:265142_1
MLNRYYQSNRRSWIILTVFALLIITMFHVDIMNNERQSFESIKTANRQYSCVNCGQYTKTYKCIRLLQQESTKDFVRTELKKCNVYSDEERPWMNWLFSDKSVFEISPPETTTEKAPKEIPDDLREEYTLGKRIDVGSWYFKEIYAGNENRVLIWTEEDIERIIMKIKAGQYPGGYEAAPYMYDVLQKYSHHLNGRGVVIGSASPWVECAALAANRDAHITTYEYSTIKSTHPRITSIKPSEFARMYAQDKYFEPFDWAVSFSSIEHSGLGRFGDPLNPWGDVQAMARVSCMLKPGGLFFLALPTGAGGVDGLMWNAHRIYGRTRFRFMLENFRVIEATKPMYKHPGDQEPTTHPGDQQPMVVLQNMRGCTNGNLDRF